jgi:hypothetical protein
MTFEEAVDQMKTTCNHPCQIEFLDRVLNARPQEKRIPEMPPFTRERESLMQLRPRHLIWVEEIGISETYDRGEMHDYMMENYDRLFGPLRRPKSREVPSDQFRKSVMISTLLDLAESRREEYARERSSRSARK